MGIVGKIILFFSVLMFSAAAAGNFARAAAPLYSFNSFTASTVSSSEIDLSWSYLSASYVNPPLTGYKIERESPVGGGFTQIAVNVAGSSYADTNLSPNVLYNYRITAVNADGASPPITAYTTTNPALAPLAPPNPPQNVTVTGGYGSMSVSWSLAPNSTAATGYKIERSNGGGGYDVLVANSGSTGTSYTDSNLSPGVSYGYRVTAISSYGYSIPSITAWGTTFTLPSAPGSATAVAGNSQATVNWTQPLFTGGDITGYLIAGSPNVTSISVGSNVRSATVTGLVNGVSYTFSVTAVNSLGQGPAARTDSVVPGTPPAGGSPPPAVFLPQPPSTPPPPPSLDNQSLQTQLNALMAQLQLLTIQAGQQQTTSPASPPTNISISGTATTTPAFTRNLYFGIRGEDVRTLQNFLIKQDKGPEAEKLAKNGSSRYFGILTQRALAEYQVSVGITPASGYFGPKTRAQISSIAQ